MSLGDVREGLLLFLNMEWVRYLQFSKEKYSHLYAYAKKRLVCRCRLS